MTAPHILLPFIDDSTLFFAVRMRDLLHGVGVRPVLGWFNEGSPLSDRQLIMNLPDGPDMTIPLEALEQPEFMAKFDAIVTSRVLPELRQVIKEDVFQTDPNRPVIVTFQGGLDFTPQKAFTNRRHGDVVFVVPNSDIPAFRAFAKAEGFGPQIVAFGHPTFLQPDPTVAVKDGSGDVYFFAQAISPPTKAARQHIVAMLAAMARRHRNRDIYIKLRHLPNENQAHLHRERYAYPQILDVWHEPLPDNLKVTACSMDEAIARAGIGLTCTSTAAIDLLRAGLPTLITLDYVEHYLDPMAAEMRGLFEGSGLIAPLEDVLNLRVRPPNEAWLHNMLCPRDLAVKLLEVIAQAKSARR